MGKTSFGALGMCLTVFALAQRLGGYENKSLAVALAVGASLALGWVVIQLVRDGIHWYRARQSDAQRPHLHVWKTVALSVVLIVSAAGLWWFWRSLLQNNNIVSAAAPPPQAISPQNAPGGIINNGGQVTGNTINNYPPPNSAPVAGILHPLVPVMAPDPPLSPSLIETIDMVKTNSNGLEESVRQRRLAALPGPDDVKVFLGNNFGMIRRSREVVIRINHKDLLTINKESAGLSVDVLIFDSTGKVVFGIDHNTPHPNNNNLWYVEQPKDNHSIVVHGQDGEVALSVKYIGRHSLEIRGLFRYDGHLVTVNNEGFLLVDQAILNAGIFGTSGISMILIGEKTYNPNAKLP